MIFKRNNFSDFAKPLTLEKAAAQIEDDFIRQQRIAKGESWRVTAYLVTVMLFGFGVLRYYIHHDMAHGGIDRALDTLLFINMLTIIAVEVFRWRYTQQMKVMLDTLKQLKAKKKA